MGIIDEIKSNEVTILHLSEAPEDYFTDCDVFANAMKENTSIENVIFDKDFLACSVGQQRATMVSSIGMLPNAKSVALKDSLLMTGVCLTNLIKNSKSIEELKLENCLLQGRAEDFSLLQDAINASPTFQTLRMQDCSAANSEVDLKNAMPSIKDGLIVEVSGEGAKIQ